METRPPIKQGFCPIPDATNAGASVVQVWGWPFPVTLASDAASPEIHANRHEWLLAASRSEAAGQLRGSPVPGHAGTGEGLPAGEVRALAV
ncbi:MAG TPA: hypothetical protein VFU47_04795, partial [Armatimonadota bacterium]|nr:hypothetical protein [Armatimonadota bacterium]